jgi:hypothetical protein
MALPTALGCRLPDRIWTGDWVAGDVSAGNQGDLPAARHPLDFKFSLLGHAPARYLFLIDQANWTPSFTVD